MALRRWIWITGAILGTGGFGIILSASATFCELALRVPRPAHRLTALPATLAGSGVWSNATIRAQDGVRLGGWFIRPREGAGTACVVVMHGIADSRAGETGFAPMFLSHGYSVLLPDSRAHGASGGGLVTYGLLEKYDAVEWAHWLRRAGCRQVYGLGESLGASVLIQASALEPAFDAIASECAYADLKAIALCMVPRPIPHPVWLADGLSQLVVRSGLVYARFRYGLDFDQVMPVRAMERTRTPILLIHGLKDDRTPYWHSQVLVRANPRAALWLVPNAGHTAASTTDPDGFWKHVLGWYESHSAGSVRETGVAAKM